MIDQELNRRQFLGTTLTIAGGLLVSFYIPGVARKALAAAAAGGDPVLTPNQAFIHIAPDNTITLVISKLEMGQGVNTSMAQLIAEELECDWTKIKSISASVNAIYNHPTFHMQITGGSTALASTWDQYRRVGAGMREMLKTAAAAKWGVKASQVKAEKGYVIHGAKKLSYGELADEANKLPFPGEAPLKKTSEFKVIGKSMKRVDAAAKSNGTAEFGIDVRIPGMLYCMVARPPITGAKLKSTNESAARQVKGVVDVVRFMDRVAVLATNTHSAKVGRAALAATWDIPRELQVNSPALMQKLRDQASKGVTAVDRGDVNGAFAKAKKIVEAEYEFPFLAHASMEPMNCTIHYDGKKAELWSGFQMPTMDRIAAAKVLGLAPEQVTLHVTYAGGSFGRRGNKHCDYVVEAAELAKVVKKPLKIVWTREDDMQGGYYRPIHFHRVRLAFDDKKNFLAWDHQIAGQSIVENSPMEDDGEERHRRCDGGGRFRHPLRARRLSLPAGAGYFSRDHFLVALGGPHPHRLRDGDRDGRIRRSFGPGSARAPQGIAQGLAPSYGGAEPARETNRVGQKEGAQGPGLGPRAP